MPSPRSTLAAIVAVFVAVLLASPQTRAAVKPSDADADVRLLDGDDDDDLARVAARPERPRSKARALGGPDVAALARVVLGSAGAFAIESLPSTAYGGRAATVALDGPRSRGPP